jgi:hypothetical protein
MGVLITLLYSTLVAMMRLVTCARDMFAMFRPMHQASANAPYGMRVDMKVVAVTQGHHTPVVDHVGWVG